MPRFSGKWPLWLGIAILFLFTAWLFAMLGEARAHGEAGWISDGRFTDPATNAWCCGVADCDPLPDEAVKITPRGYFLAPTGETIPESRALPSIDGRYWRCRYLAGEQAGKTRCFFRGVPGS